MSNRHKTDKGKKKKIYTDLETYYLVPIDGQVDSEDAHAVEDKLHRGHEIVQHCRLPKTKFMKNNGNETNEIYKKSQHLHKYA